jgi:adenylate kinase family enzyme
VKRIIIVGSGGAGKSTLAKEIGRRLRLPLVHLDAHYWKPGWEHVPFPEWEEKVKELIAGDAWVMDGNYTRTLPIRLERADTAIFLDTSRVKCIYRIIRRRLQYHNRVREDIGEGCYEKLDYDFVKWVWDYNKRSGKKVKDILEQEKERKNIIMLKTERDIENFLQSLP